MAIYDTQRTLLRAISQVRESIPVADGGHTTSSIGESNSGIIPAVLGETNGQPMYHHPDANYATKWECTSPLGVAADGSDVFPQETRGESVIMSNR